MFLAITCPALPHGLSPGCFLSSAALLVPACQDHGAGGRPPFLPCLLCCVVPVTSSCTKQTVRSSRPLLSFLWSKSLAEVKWLRERQRQINHEKSTYKELLPLPSLWSSWDSIQHRNAGLKQRP